MMTPAVILDRDGVLNPTIRENGRERAPNSWTSFSSIREFAKRFIGSRKRFPVVVITNQKEVARGIIAREEVERIHARLRRTLPILDVLTCYHADDAGCLCHKPKPGLFFEAAEKHDLDLGRSVSFGDHWIDTQAAQAAGCATTILIERVVCDEERCPPTRCFDDFATAADWLLAMPEKDLLPRLSARAKAR